MNDALIAHFRRASFTLASAIDVVNERATGEDPPSWCLRRGWDPFLLDLDPDALARAEREGLAASIAATRGAPPDLVALARAVKQCTDLPAAPVAPPESVDPRRSSPRKRTQVARFSWLVSSLAPDAARIVDVGSGHGHLTRHLARSLGVAAEGWEWDEARVAVANRLTGTLAATFLALDVRADCPSLSPSDLVVGLHACGELGDHAVRIAREGGAAIGLVGCCLQKREGDRAPLVVPAGLSAGDLTLRRGILGLGNARDGEEGVEASLETRTRSRANRSTLRLLFSRAGLELQPGEEMRGQNRRRATGPLEDLVARAFTERHLPVPTAVAIADAAGATELLEARARRRELPRTMLARLMEVWVALDRAAFLAEAGYDADVVLAFDVRESPRNVAVIGRRGVTVRSR